MTHYETLGVEPTATEDEIRAAYRRLARKYHPDVSTEPDREAMIRAINEARDVLLDAERRRAHDVGADTTPDQKTVEATGMLVRYFNDAVNQMQPVVPFVATCIDLLKREAIASIDMNRQRQKKLYRRGRSVKCKGKNNLFEQVIDREKAAVVDQIAQAEQLIEVATLARQMLDDYETVYEEPASPMVGLLPGAFSVSGQYPGYLSQGGL